MFSFFFSFLCVSLSDLDIDVKRLLMNEGRPEAVPTVVLGISGKPENMCNLELIQRDKVRVGGRTDLCSFFLHVFALWRRFAAGT